MITLRDVQEALAVIWSEIEKGNADAAEIKKILSQDGQTGEYGRIRRHGRPFSDETDDIVKHLESENLLTESGGKITFTEAGRKRAARIIRLHRLAERLLHDVLEIHGGAMHLSACEFEHIMSDDVEESVCTLLGHPRLCPHGSPIPAGVCCKMQTSDARPIITTLDRLGAGDEARISYIYTKDHALLHKLLSLGLVPGAVVKIHQKSPSLVLNIGATTLALEEDVAKMIFARR